MFDFLQRTGYEEYIDRYNLQSFEVNVLNKEQTLLEKIVSLIRFSFDEDAFESISKKVRHFYDLYFLMNDPVCAGFMASDAFRKQFNTILQHDREMFNEPKGWQDRLISESPLIVNFEHIWNKLSVIYQTELSALVYRDIPDERAVAKKFRGLIERIE